MLVPSSGGGTPFGKFWIQLYNVHEIVCFEDQSANANICQTLAKFYLNMNDNLPVLPGNNQILVVKT